LRPQYADVWYDEMNRGRRGEKVFAAMDDYGRFIYRLKEPMKLFVLQTSAWCAASNYSDLLTQGADGNLDRCLRRSNGISIQRFKHAHIPKVSASCKI